jgi:DnaJ-like protein
MSKREDYKPKFGYDMRIKPPGKGKAKHSSEHICEWEGCEQKADHKAPKSRTNVHEYQWFCLDHVREFNRSWNFFDGWDEDEVREYQKASSTGHRPTWKMGDNSPSTQKGPSFDNAEDPFRLFERTRGGKSAPRRPERKLPKQVENAYFTLGLRPPASPEKIKTRYKELVKKFHPDANQGEKGYEERLKRIIEAYQNLKSAGFC